MFSLNKFKKWWLLLLAGCALFTIGVFALAAPFHTYIYLIAYSGSVLLMNGAFLVIIPSDPTCKREKNWMAAESMVDFVFGTLLLFNPLLTFIVLPLLIGSWIFCIGVLKILAALALRKIIYGWKLIFAAGLIAATFGLLIIQDVIPKATGITTLTGLFGITMGCLDIFDAYRFRKTTEELNMMF
jgi:uncharacterized membrane protein HdeD (DUF308 family)